MSSPRASHPPRTVASSTPRTTARFTGFRIAACVPLGTGFVTSAVLMMTTQWLPRSPERMPDSQWEATVTRIRSEFKEMPCLRVTRDEARTLFGLRGAASDWVLARLARDGFLVQTPDGQYVRRN